MKRQRERKKLIIEEYKKLARSSTPAMRLSIPKRKLRRNTIVKKVVEEDEKVDDAKAGGLFALTEVNPNAKKVAAELPPVSPSKGAQKKDEENDFWKLSPRCILDKINESIRNGEKVRFKGIGLEATHYYKKYMMDRSVQEKHEKNKVLAEEYFKAVKCIKRPNEHVKSFNRIKEQLQKIADRKATSFTVILESNLENAFKLMNRDLNRVTAYAKYNPNFP